MPIIEDTKFKKHVEAEEFYPVYLLFGQEKFLLKRALSRLESRAKKAPFPEFNWNGFGSEAGVDEIADAALGMPFMAERKFVFVSDLNVESLNASELSKLNELLENLSESTVLVFTYPTLLFDGKKSAKWRNFLKACEKNGACVEFTQKEKSDLVKFLVTAAEKNDAVLPRQQAEKIIEYCGTDLTALNNEISKLSAYCAGREITPADVEEMVTKNTEAKVFALSKAIISGNYDESYRILDNLLYAGEKPVAILSVLSSAYVDLYRVRAALQSGRKSDAPAEYGEYKGKEFRLRNAERDIRNLSAQVLKESLDVLLETDLLLKGSKVPARRNLEEMIAKLLLVTKGEGKR